MDVKLLDRSIQLVPVQLKLTNQLAWLSFISSGARMTVLGKTLLHINIASSVVMRRHASGTTSVSTKVS